MKKKVFLALCISILVFSAFAACTPDGGELREEYKGAGYDFQPFDITGAGVEEYEVSDFFSAVKNANSRPVVVYVLCFATLGEARAYTDEHVGDNDKANLSRRGRLVAYGDAEGVEIAVK